MLAPEPEIEEKTPEASEEFFDIGTYTPEEEQPEHFTLLPKKRAVTMDNLNEEQRIIFQFMQNHPFEDTIAAPDVEYDMLQNLGAAKSKSNIGKKRWKITYENGTKYEGSIVEDSQSSNYEQPISAGNFFFPNGDTYEGTVGVRASGTYTHKNGVEYKGQFYKLAKSGNGEQTFPCGTVYRGMFRENIYHGKGTMNFANGDKYQGTFNNGKREHIGKYMYPSGETVVGDWQHDMLHGNARYEFTNGNKLMSSFENSAIKM